MALAILSSPLAAGVDYATRTGNIDEITKEVTDVLRAALRL